MIALGGSLLVPVSSIVESTASTVSPVSPVSPVPGEVVVSGTYTVRRGDYLYGIARATGTDLGTLLSLNGLSLRSVIRPGQVLKT